MKEERLRLQVVKQFEQLNIKYDQDLKYIISIAAKICRVHISSITILDKDTQWLKIKQGLNFDQIPRNLSFCKYTIKRRGLLVVNDTHLDKRFYDNPYVTGHPRIRFYAGCPIITHDNHHIGTLCVMSDKPKLLNEQERLILKILAKYAMSVMERKLSMDKLNESFHSLRKLRESKSTCEIKLRVMFENLSDAYFLLGKKAEIIDFNRTAYNFINDNYSITLSYGRIMTGFLKEEHRAVFSFHYQNALNGKRMQLEKLANYGVEGQNWWHWIFEPVKNDNGEIIGVSYIVRDINERKLYEEKVKEQNKILLRVAEIQAHDYRAPVASILGLMNLIEEDDYIASKEYLIMMQTAARNLDEKIHEVMNVISK
jgi:PAS domain S-box-containing protein